MLSCRQISETATDYLEGSLTLRQRAAIRFHLLMCKHCRAYVDQLAKTVVLLKAAVTEGDAALELDPRLIEAFRNGTDKSRPWK